MEADNSTPKATQPEQTQEQEVPQKPAYQTAELEDRDDNKNFYDQFDRESPLFHGGITTPVPIGGKNIPPTMNCAYPEGFDPNAPVSEDKSATDPDCILLKKTISDLKTYKKKWTQIVDSFCKRRTQVDTKELQDVKVMTKKLREQINAAKAFEAECQEGNKFFSGYESEQEAFLNYIESLGKISAGEKEHKIALIKLELQKFTRVVFKQSTESMKLYKDRKKVVNSQ